MRFFHTIVFTLCLFIIIHSQSPPMHLQIVNVQILTDQQQAVIFNNDNLNEVYDENIFDDSSNCRNGKLNIVNNTYSNSMVVKYLGFPTIKVSDINIICEPNYQPQSQPVFSNQTYFTISFNCPDPSITKINSDNFWNKIKVSIRDKVSFSFLLDCDPNNRHKQFQYGYLIISLINAAITIGVAMHSYVWSIKIQFRPLRYHLKWIPFLFFSLVGIGIVVAIYFFASNDFIQAFIFVKYAGIAISVFFVFICFNEIFYLIKELRKPIFQSIRICQIFSAMLTILLTLLAVFFQNWILYDFIAGFICIGCIKIFHFTTLKDAFISMGIMILTVTSIAISLHYILPLSYNDYATELSSPLFFQVPDLINSLFKKCSWLPIIDVILPGITLSYLRLYDQNRSSKWGGVYTLSGNVAFVLSTILWIGLQLVYPFSVPFSLVTYPCLMATIFILAWRRNEWHTLLYGLFQQGYDTINSSMLQENHRSFSKHISKQAISDVLINSDKVGSSIIDE